MATEQLPQVINLNLTARQLDGLICICTIAAAGGLDPKHLRESIARVAPHRLNELNNAVLLLLECCNAHRQENPGSSFPHDVQAHLIDVAEKAGLLE